MSTMNVTTAAPAAPRMHGRWLNARSRRPPMSAHSAAPASGSAGMYQSSAPTSPIALLLAGADRFETRGGQLRQRLFRLGRRQRLGLAGGLHPFLAQVLPGAHVERLAAAVEHEHQRQRDRSLARGHGDDE